MTLSDPDLVERLREQRYRAAGLAPAPRDLAARTRARYRFERRRRLGVAAATLAVLVAIVGVPTVATTLLGGDRSSPAGAPDLYDAPTRGSLAGDTEWLDAMAARDWGYDGTGPVPEEAVPSDVRAADRRVAFAGDVPTGRIALVLGRAGDVLFEIWFAGPTGAAPDEMARVTLPGTVTDAPLVGLWDRPSADAAGVLVVVASPGQALEYATGHEITDEGSFQWDWQPLTAEDGVAITPVDVPPGGYGPARVRAGSGPLTYVSVSERTTEVELSQRELADPRGLLDRLERRHLDHAVWTLESYFGLPASELDPVLLWGGRSGDGLTDTSALVGVTLPSGATAAIAVGYQPFTGAAGSSRSTTLSIGAPAPPGRDLLDRVIAIPAPDWIAISAPPSGVVAELGLEDGTVIGTTPLAEGAGSVAFSFTPFTSPLPTQVRVRVLDSDGEVVGEAPALPEMEEWE